MATSKKSKSVSMKEYQQRYDEQKAFTKKEARKIKVFDLIEMKSLGMPNIVGLVLKKNFEYQGQFMVINQQGLLLSHIECNQVVANYGQATIKWIEPL